MGRKKNTGSSVIKPEVTSKSVINKTLLIEISQKDNHNELIKREQCFTRGKKKKRLAAVMNVSQCVSKKW